MSETFEPRPDAQPTEGRLSAALGAAGDPPTTHAHELGVLYRFTDRLFRAEQEVDVYEAALDAILTGLRCNRASILLFDEAGAMQFVASRGLSENYQRAVAGHSPWSSGERHAEPIHIDDIGAADLAAGLKATVRAEGIEALAFIPLATNRGVIGKFMAYHDAPHAFSSDELDLALTIARQLGFAIDRKKSERSLRDSERRLERELTATQHLQSVGAVLIEGGDSSALYQEIVDAAAAIMASDFASMQMYHPDRGTNGELQLLATRGFDPAATKFWTWVRADSACTCGVALHTGRRVITSNVETCEFMAGTEDLQTSLQAGMRAVQSTPLVSRSGRLLGMISTHWRTPHNPAESDLRLLDVLARQAADLIERTQAETALRESEQRFRMVAENIDQLAWTCDRLGDATWYNKRWLDYTGLTFEEMQACGWEQVQHPDHIDRVVAGIARSRESGEPWEDTCPLRGKDGEYRWFLSRAVPIHDERGQVLRWFGSNTDITERLQAEEQRTLLINELNHRVKNTLATVQSLAMQTLREDEQNKAPLALFNSRLGALARAHDILTQENWKGAQLRQIVDQSIAPFRTTDRIDVGGPDARVTPKQALALTIALHELGTNAMKYGALSNQNGRITLAWSVADGALHMNWRENGGPPVSPPTRSGFGTRLIERSLSNDLGGDARILYLPAGVVAQMSTPLEAQG